MSCALRDHCGDAGDIQTAGRAVDHGHAVQQHARGQCTEHEILHRRLGGRRGVTVEGHHRVQRKRQQFQSEIDRQQAVRRHHHLHAQHREQAQHVVLAAQGALRGQVAARIGKGADHHQEDAGLQQRCHRIVHEHVAQRQGAPGIQRTGTDQGGDQQGQLGQHIAELRPALAEEGLQHQDGAGHAEHEHLGQEQREFGQRNTHRVHLRAVWPAAAPPRFRRTAACSRTGAAAGCRRWRASPRPAVRATGRTAARPPPGWQE